jgi:hypothetical protein
LSAPRLEEGRFRVAHHEAENGVQGMLPLPPGLQLLLLPGAC